ncbi:hypothetical protein [Pseudonocardia sp. GCM10023141]|uniref:hypothetical protein n=1 Tax=Pseudonocardia sp. GCM10023141 TaxID=3252653 RepID=UPI00361009F3
MVGWIILVVLLVVAAAAPRYGTDSRTGHSGARRRIGDDLRDVRQTLTRFARAH